MKGNLKSIPVKYVLCNRDCIFIYDHHFGNLDDLCFGSCSEIKNFIYLFIQQSIFIELLACT